MQIKETLEVFTALEAVCGGILKACEDGKLGLLDLRHVLEPAKAAAAAVRGAEQVPAELKDVDEAELNQLIDRAAAVAIKATEAFTALAAALGK